MAAHRAPALQASAMVADEESSGHTSSESDGYIQEVLQEVEAEEIQRNRSDDSIGRPEHCGAGGERCFGVQRVRA